ncbi:MULTISPECIES: UbiA family prenyltransferase [unclassified Microbacterium]|uniref:UbiA family prenyltransferase n=1 Tax=unclassified Microbacterium TaxID=2609290 RepID=UPI003018CA32
MTPPGPGGSSRRLAVGALWRSSHPGPTLVVSVLALVLGVSAGLDAGRLALLTGAVFAGQLSVGWSNDAIDARRDASVGRADKPIARGEISARAVGTAAVAAVLVALAASAVLGPGFLVAHTIALGSAWGYNAWLKNTAASTLPFVVSFGLFPSLATLARADPLLASPWATLAGAALGIAVHFSNVLPDFDDDAATGIRGTPHRLGRRASAVVSFVALAVGAGAVALGPVLAGGGETAVPLAAPLGLLSVATIAAIGLIRALRTPDRVVFRLVMLAALVLVLQLALTGSRLSP